MSQYVDNALYCLLFPKLLLPVSQGSNTLPVGTILPYVGDLSKIPHGWALCDGTNGTPNLTGRFLQGSNIVSAIGDFIEPGLPNITGTIGVDSSFIYNNGINLFSGPFQLFTTQYFGGGVSAGVGGKAVICKFNAAECSLIYGRSETVQPPAYTVFYIMRII